MGTTTSTPLQHGDASTGSAGGVGTISADSEYGPNTAPQGSTPAGMDEFPGFYAEILTSPRSPQHGNGPAALSPNGRAPTESHVPVAAPTALVGSITKSTSKARPLRNAAAGFETAIILDPRCLYHSTESERKLLCQPNWPHEPERPLRIQRIYERLKQDGLLTKVLLDVSELPTADALLAVHSAEYLDRLRKLQQSDGDPTALLPELKLPDLAEAQAMLESPAKLKAFLETQIPFVDASRTKRNGIVDEYPADNPHTEYTPVAAALSAGAVTRLIDMVAGGHCVNGMSIMRPPGHHCAPDHAAGFCYLANVAIGVKWARSAHGVKRVAVIDWDVHAGDGTESSLKDDPDVLVVSLHRNEASFFPFGQPCGPGYTGSGPSAGHFVNIGWEGVDSPHGMGDNEYAAAFAAAVLPVLTSFAPEMIIISCGYDAADGDPLGGQHLSPPMYRAMTKMLGALDPPRGLILVLEGGYNVDSISASASQTVKALLELAETSRRRLRPAGSGHGTDGPAAGTRAAEAEAGFLREGNLGSVDGADVSSGPAARLVMSIPSSVRPVGVARDTSLGMAVHAAAVEAVHATLHAHAPHWDVAAQAAASIRAFHRPPVPRQDPSMSVSTYADLAQVEAGSTVVLWRDAGQAAGAHGATHEPHAPLFARMPVCVFGKPEFEQPTTNVREERGEKAIVTRHAAKVTSPPQLVGRPSRPNTACAWKAVSRSHTVSIEVDVAEDKAAGQAVTQAAGRAVPSFRVRDELQRTALDVQLATPAALRVLGLRSTLSVPDKIPSELCSALPKELFKVKYHVQVLLRAGMGIGRASDGSSAGLVPGHLIIAALSSFTFPASSGKEKSTYPYVLAVWVPGHGLVNLTAGGPTVLSRAIHPPTAGQHAIDWAAAWDTWIRDCDALQAAAVADGRALDPSELPPCPDMTSDNAVPVTALGLVTYDKGGMKKMVEAAMRAVAMCTEPLAAPAIAPVPAMPTVSAAQLAMPVAMGTADGPAVQPAAMASATPTAQAGPMPAPMPPPSALEDDDDDLGLAASMAGMTTGGMGGAREAGQGDGRSWRSRESIGAVQPSHSPGVHAGVQEPALGYSTPTRGTSTRTGQTGYGAALSPARPQGLDSDADGGELTLDALQDQPGLLSDARSGQAQAFGPGHDWPAGGAGGGGTMPTGRPSYSAPAPAPALTESAIWRDVLADEAALTGTAAAAAGGGPVWPQPIGSGVPQVQQPPAKPPAGYGRTKGGKAAAASTAPAQLPSGFPAAPSIGSGFGSGQPVPAAPSTPADTVKNRRRSNIGAGQR